MYYQIRDTLIDCKKEDLSNREYNYAAKVTSEEFKANQDVFDMGFDSALEIVEITHAKTNYDSMTGCITIPDRFDADAENKTFGFALDERGVVFIDDGETVNGILEKIQKETKWKRPSFERFLYDFLGRIIDSDLDNLEKFDEEMDGFEDRIFADDMDGIQERLYNIRKVLISLSRHYERLIDLSDKLYANDNGFFDNENVRFFQMFSERVTRLLQTVSSLKDHTMQIRDLYHTKLDEKQNNNMSVLTVIATIFTPITILTGWYGMNFTHMPELDEPYAYPLLLGICLVIIVTSLIVFKKKKWL